MDRDMLLQDLKTYYETLKKIRVALGNEALNGADYQRILHDAKRNYKQLVEMGETPDVQDKTNIVWQDIIN